MIKGDGESRYEGSGKAGKPVDPALPQGTEARDFGDGSGARSARTRGARTAVATVEGRRGDALDPRAAPRRGRAEKCGVDGAERKGRSGVTGEGGRCRLTRRGILEAGAGGRYRAAGRDPAEEKKEKEREGERGRREREREDTTTERNGDRERERQEEEENVSAAPAQNGLVMSTRGAAGPAQKGLLSKWGRHLATSSTTVPLDRRCQFAGL